MSTVPGLDKARQVEGLWKHATKLPAPTQRRGGLAVCPSAPTYIDDDAINSAILALVEGDYECEHQAQLRPDTPAGSDPRCLITSADARRRLVVDASMGAMGMMLRR